MSSVRIRMPKGHSELSLEGHTYKIDEEGAFTVPEHMVPLLVDSHGAQLAPSVQDLEAKADAAEQRL